MADVLEIVRGISDILTKMHDGALDEKGEPVKIGLRREEEIPITDSRVVDGFAVKFDNEKLCVYYHSDVKLKEVHSNGFENEMSGYIDSVVSHIKKQYRKNIGSHLGLTKEGEVDVKVQTISRVRSAVVARQDFKIGGFGKDVDILENESDDSVDKNFKSWLKMGDEVGSGAKKNQADSRKQGDEE